MKSMVSLVTTSPARGTKGVTFLWDLTFPEQCQWETGKMQRESGESL